MKKIRYYHYLLYGFLAFAKTLFTVLPYRAGFAIGTFLGRASYGLLRRERDRALGHLRMAFGPEKSETEIRRIAKGLFENYGQCVAEFIMVDQIMKNLDGFVRHTGYEHFDRALGAGKGAVCVIAHFGNWELMGGYTALKGYPCNVIARNIYFKRYDDYIVQMRKKMKVRNIYRDEPIRNMLGALHRNEMLGFVVDQDVEGVDGVFVDFFGRKAFTATAPVRFAMSAGAPLIPVFIVREGLKHRMIVEPAVELTVTGNKKKDILVNTQKWVAVQERYIRQYPHLWVWNHRRWKTEPARLAEIETNNAITQS